MTCQYLLYVDLNGFGHYTCIWHRCIENNQSDGHRKYVCLLNLNIYE